jgi:hypothetical protein
MKLYFAILFCVNSLILFSQNDSKEYIIVNIHKESIIPDFHFYLDMDKFDKNDTPKLYFSESIINYTQDDANVLSENMNFLNFSQELNLADFIVFRSQYEKNIIFFEVFFKREKFLNKPNKNEYEFWRRMNGGIRYIFEFENNKSLKRMKKKWFSYD